LLQIAEAPFLEAALVERVALDQMLAQHLGSPNPELGAAGRLDAVAHGDDYIEVVEAHGPVGTGNVQKMHIAFLGQLPLSKHVAHVAGDHRAFTAKQFRHLGLTEPDGVSLEAHIE
jgi:hypothetical protein